MRHQPDEAVDVAAQVDLDEVARLELCVLGLQRRVVAHHVVDGEAGGEGHALLHLLVLGEHLLGLRLDQAVAEGAEFGDAGLGHALRDHGFEHL